MKVIYECGDKVKIRSNNSYWPGREGHIIQISQRIGNETKYTVKLTDGTIPQLTFFIWDLETDSSSRVGYHQAKFYHIDVHRNIRTELKSSKYILDSIFLNKKLEGTSERENSIEFRVDNSIYGIEFEEVK